MWTAEKSSAGLRRDRRGAGNRASSTTNEMRNKRLRKIKHPAQANIHHGIIILRFNIHDADWLGNPRVVDENINSSEILDDLPGDGLAGVFLSHVANVSPMVLPQDGGFLLRRIPLELKQRNRCAVFSKETGRGITNSVLRCRT